MQSVLGNSGTCVKEELATQELSYGAIDGTNLEVMAGTCVVQGSVKSLELYESTLQPTNDMTWPLRCRLCTSPNTEMVDIFNSYRTNDVLQKIEYCLHIVVRETDVLPKRVCRLCLGELELCYRFQKTVAVAEEKLLAFSRQTCGKLETENNFQTSSLCIGQHGVTEYEEIGETFKTPPDLKEVLTTNTTPKINPLLACLKPCSVILVPTEVTNLHDITKHRRNSSDIKLTDSGQKSAPEISQPATNDLEVSRITANKSRTNASETLSSDCQEKLERAMTKQKHLEIRGPGHTKRKRVFKCSLCPKLFLSKAGLTRHIKIYTGPGHTRNKEAFKCSSCPESFTSTAGLTRHNKIYIGPGHTRNKEAFKCSSCPKLFASKVGLTSHNKIYTGPGHTRNKEVFKCSSCPKLFSSKVGLSLYNKIHTGLGLYGCDFCEKKFGFKLDRDRHHSVHTGERPFKCPLCERAFARQHGRKKHIAMVHSDVSKLPVFPVR